MMILLGNETCFFQLVRTRSGVLALVLVVLMISPPTFAFTAASITSAVEQAVDTMTRAISFT